MSQRIKSRITIILANGMLVVAGFLLFSVTANQLLFSFLPKSEGWLRLGIYTPYFLIIIGAALIVVFVKMSKKIE